MPTARLVTMEGTQARGRSGREWLCDVAMHLSVETGGAPISLESVRNHMARCDECSGIDMGPAWRFVMDLDRRRANHQPPARHDFQHPRPSLRTERKQVPGVG